MKKIKAVATERGDNIDYLRSSPIRGIQPVSPDPIEIEIDRIEEDPSNPGLNKDREKSLRYVRRGESMRDSIDIIGGIIYPVVVCQKEQDAAQFILVDGHGRKQEAQNRGMKTIRALVFPYLNLEQRICLREVLNAAQEPFDPVSVIRDLWQLAKARGLQLRTSEEVKTLVRDLPKRVRNREKDLVMLGRWHPEAVSKLGESYKQNGQAIGLDKFKELDGIVRALEEKHPNTLERLGGAREITLILARMYTDGKFREGRRSQEAIRAVTKAIATLPAEHDKVYRFLDEQLSWTVFEPDIKSTQLSSDLVKACKDFAALLLEVGEPESIDAKQRRALERTASVLNQVLGQ